MTGALYVHSSAGRYGADRQLALLAQPGDTVLLPFEGPLVDDLRADVVIGPVPVLRREHLTTAGLARLARDVARTRAPLQRLIARRGIDVVHANTSVILGLRAVAPRLVTHVREIYPDVPVAWPLHRRAILASDAVVCISHAVRRALGGGAVIHDGLAVPPVRVTRARARLALGLPGDAFVAAVPGRVSAWKGQELLAGAVAQIPGAITLVAGDAWPGQERHERALDALPGVHRVGFRDDVETVYGAADVVVVPSTRPEPLGLVAMEAAAAGCCVVAANHGGLPEIITDGVTGRLFAPGDQRALRDVLVELRDDPEQRERLGAAAAADVAERFDPARLTAAIAAVHSSLRTT